MVIYQSHTMDLGKHILQCTVQEQLLDAAGQLIKHRKGHRQLRQPKSQPDNALCVQLGYILHTFTC